MFLAVGRANRRMRLSAVNFSLSRGSREQTTPNPTMLNESNLKALLMLTTGVCFLTLLGPIVVAQEPETTALVHSRPSLAPVTGNHFGDVVVLDGEWLAVGDPLDNYVDNGGVAFHAGSVHMYGREASGWELKQYIVPPIPPPLGERVGPMGYFIALDGNRMALGGFEDPLNQFAGTVWIYEFNGADWVITDRIDPVVQRRGVFFGFGLQLDGDDLYVVAPVAGIHDPLVPRIWSGAIERYHHSGNGWSRVEVIEPQSLALAPRFCNGAAEFKGNVGVVRCAEGATGLVSPYLRVFEGGAGAWQETAIIPGVVYPGADEGFGASTAVWGDWIAVGIPIYDWNLFQPVGRPGQVFLYHRLAPGNWSLYQEIEASNSWFGGLQGHGETDRFGVSVDFNDDGQLVVGAMQGRNGVGRRYCGQAYLFEFDGTSWLETRRFTSNLLEEPTYNQDSWFGVSVSADGPYIAVGDPIGSFHPQPNSIRVGRAYLYETGIGQMTCPGVPTTTQVGARLTARGSDAAHVGVVDFFCSQMPSFTLGLLIAGPQSGFTPNPGGSAGNLCVGGVIARLTTGHGPSDLVGRWSGAVELPDPSAPGNFAVTPGTTWHFQLWFRQPANPPTSNFSSGLAITFE